MYEEQCKATHTEAAVLVKTGKGFVARIIATYGATSDTLILYDNTAASGTKLLELDLESADVSGKTKEVQTIECGFGFTNGLYASFTGGSNQIDHLTVVFR